jgi:electron transfer flavoprotein alpha subunit
VYERESDARIVSMSNYIVLIKQVPDVTQITDNAFNPQTGTLLRSRLPSVINELDTQAFAFAHLMKHISNDADAKVVCLTMGPPMAEEVLRYGLSRGADIAVLLTDRALGGADTYATANPLSFAVRRIVKDFFNDNSDYFIVCGMQSVDGDTAQVPAQIAEELKLPCVPYATGVEYNSSRFEFTRIISGGSQVVASRTLPCVITVAKYEYPMFAGFAAARRASKTKLVQWGADDIKPAALGIDGSKTRVIRVFPPGKTSRKCQQLTDIKSLVGAILERFATAEEETKVTPESYTLPSKRQSRLDRHFEGTEKEIEDFKLLSVKLAELGIDDITKITDQIKAKILDAAAGRFHRKALEDMIAGFRQTSPMYQGDVWVVAEHSNSTPHTATLELIGKARELANSLEVKVGVVLAGHKVETMGQELIAAGADNIYIIEHPLLAEFDPCAYRKAVSDVIGKYWPQIVLFSATPQGRVLAPMVSYRLGCGLTADCTSLDIRDSSRKGEIGILMQTRPALGGNVMATISTKDSKSQMATARPGVMKKVEPDLSRKGSVIKHNVAFGRQDVSLEIIRSEIGQGSVNLTHAEVIVSGGKGMQSRDNWEQLLASIADALSKKLGVTVERGASRAAVEHGFAERIRQVGQTGTSVGPKLYIALGISGAIQHMIGVANSQTIIAINADPHAPIFKMCDYYIIGNVEDILPKLVQALEGL